MIRCQYGNFIKQKISIIARSILSTYTYLVFVYKYIVIYIKIIYGRWFVKLYYKNSCNFVIPKKLLVYVLAVRTMLYIECL